jgi:hypothetical protein
LNPMTMKKTSLIVILILLTGVMHGQLSDDEFEKLLEIKDVVILNENTKISLVAKKALYIEVIVDKEIEYQILESTGNEKINPLILPERFDEVYRPHNSEIRDASRIFDDVRIHLIKAELVKPEGDTVEVEYTSTTREHLSINNEDRFGSVFTYIYSFPDFEPGEILRLRYTYSFPFKYNWGIVFSSRIFHDTNIPRKQYEFALIHDAKLEIDTFFANGAIPEQLHENNSVIYKWEYKNQPGCIDEPGSRPHVNVPWFTFTPKPYEFIYQHFNSFIEEFVPFWYFLSYEREAKIRKAFVDSHLGVKSRDNLFFERSARRFTSMAPNDTTGRTKLRYFQRYVVDSVRYDDAFALYKRLEGNRKLSPGGDLYSGLIKEPNKESIYAGMLPRLGCQFFTAYIDDIRSGYIFEDYYAPIYDNELLFAAVTEDDNIMFILPKSDERNLYCEELPFYYENAPVFLIFTYDFAGYKRNFNDVFRSIVTPGSETKDNYRKVNSMVNVNLNDDKILFNTRISLSGQYSTLTYPVYNDCPVDKTINPKYVRKIWEIAGDSQVELVQPNGKQIVFPYNSSVNARYSISGIDRQNDSIVALDLNRWIKHIYYPDLNATHRYTDFFADFSGSDTFAYMLEFDSPVSLIGKPETIHIENDFGLYKFNIEQTGERNILVSSFFLNKQTMVSKNEIFKVAELYSAIEEANQTHLLINIHDH